MSSSTLLPVNSFLRACARWQMAAASSNSASATFGQPETVEEGPTRRSLLRLRSRCRGARGSQSVAPDARRDPRRLWPTGRCARCPSPYFRSRRTARCDALHGASTTCRQDRAARRNDRTQLQVASSRSHCRCDVLDHRWPRGTRVETARWLVRRGAQHLVLSGRRPPNASAVNCIREFEKLGVTIRVFQADAAARDRMQFVYDQIQKDLPPLRGVVHAAGAVRDAVLLNQRWSEAPEILTGRSAELGCSTNSHVSCPLEFFILYSAAGVLLGAAGQGLYSAANAELDALAHFRRRLGIAGIERRMGILGRVAGWLLTLPPAGAMFGKREDLAKLSLPTGLHKLERLLADQVAYALSCQSIGLVFSPNCRRMPIATSSALSLMRLRHPRRQSGQSKAGSLRASGLCRRPSAGRL